MFSYRYARPSLTVDAVVLSDGEPPEVLLIRRRDEPFAGMWALPGGFVDEGERLIEAAARELVEETGVSGARLVQVGAYGDPGRDPRGWTVSVAYRARVAKGAVAPEAGDDAAALDWHRVDALPEMAFDHAQIIRDALGAG